MKKKKIKTIKESVEVILMQIEVAKSTGDTKMLKILTLMLERLKKIKG